MSNALLELLAERGHLIADGAMGTNLFAIGLETGDSPELWNVEQPDRVASVHRGFLEAGSDIVLTNSFGGNAHRLKLHGAQDRVHELNVAAARICRKAVDDWKRETGRTCLVAGSMGPTGELFEPLGPLTLQSGEAAFAAQAKGLAEGGADILWIETMSSADEMTAAVAGAAVAGLPIVATMTFDTNARTMMGLTPADLAALAAGLPTPPSAIGANCGVGPAELAQTILGLTEADPTAVVVAKGNCGIPQYVDGAIVYDGTPEAMGIYARIVRDAGARIVGGCCGSKPDHVRAIAEALRDYTPGERPTLDRIADELGAAWSKAGRLSDHAPESIEGDGGRRRGRRRRAG